jgi:large subunit ribosomal protein L6
LILDGIGYKCFKNENTIILDIGYSTLLNYTSNDKIKIKIIINKIVLFSIDKEYLNNVAIKLKKFALPNPYKGKGILFKNEIINLKKKHK